jgi:Amino acid synthesis
MPIYVRKMVHHVEETRSENGQVLENPHRVAAVAAVIENPYPDEYVEDVVSAADELGDSLGSLLGPTVVDLLDDEVEAFGKAALVGVGGEVEHGSALIHNLRFGNPFREAAGGTEMLPAAEKCGLAGSEIDIPLKHKVDARARSHHQTFSFSVSDAPAEREIMIVVAVANGGRPLARLAPFASEVGGKV